MRTILILVLVAIAGGCTASQHRWYRATVTAGGAVAQVMDVRQTQWAVDHGVPESNPLFFTEHPSHSLLAVGGALGVAAMVGWWRFVEVLPGDRGPESEYLKDLLATLPLVAEGYCVWRNSVQTGFR